MNVFVLCTGRSGSVTFIEACRHIRNYSAGHETRLHEIGPERFSFPADHIEADNRLSWHLGQLAELYGDDAFYLHLIRDRERTARSFSKRFADEGSIIAAYCQGVKMIDPSRLDEGDRMKVCLDYVDCVNTNIAYFIKGRSKHMTIELERMHEQFETFWERIGAEGELSNALQAALRTHNASSMNPAPDLFHRAGRSLKRSIRDWLQGRTEKVQKG